jgi:acyl-CoA hydrolase/rubrerythrin
VVSKDPFWIGLESPEEIGMNLKGSQTEKNLEMAFAAESKARNAYTYYAEAARQAGHPLVADVFLEIAKNEDEHARGHWGFLEKIQDTPTNLEAAAHGEHYDATTIYPGFARTAREEGFEAIADYFERMTDREARHEIIIRTLIEQLKEGGALQERTAGHSSVTLLEVMLPHQGNPAGNVHGGEIMKMMDTAAGVVAARHAHSNVVTAKVEELNFLRPVHIGELVFTHARLTFVSRTSMEVLVEVETENLATEERHKAMTASFIYVSLDKTGKPVKVPPLLITTEEGERLFEEGRKRYDTRKK